MCRSQGLLGFPLTRMITVRDTNSHPDKRTRFPLIKDYAFFAQGGKTMLINCPECELQVSDKAHDRRAHFATMAKKYNMDEYAIKRIMGHSIKDLTERVYTTRDIAWLREEIEKIK